MYVTFVSVLGSFPSELLLNCLIYMLGGVVEVAGSNLARGKIFTAFIGSVDLSLFSINIQFYEHKKCPSYMLIIQPRDRALI